MSRLSWAANPTGIAKRNSCCISKPLLPAISIHIGHFPCCDIPATLPSGGASALPVKESPELRRFQRWYHLAGTRLEVVISFCVWPCHVPVTFVIRVGGRGLARNKLDLVVRVAGVAIGQQLQRKNISKHDVPMETLDAVCGTIKHHRKSQNDGWFPTCCAAMS
jgi:hypothetical protein